MNALALTAELPDSSLKLTDKGLTLDPSPAALQMVKEFREQLKATTTELKMAVNEGAVKQSYWNGVRDGAVVAFVVGLLLAVLMRGWKT